MFLGMAHQINTVGMDGVYPLIGIGSKGTAVTVNFGDSPFKFPGAFGEKRYLPFCRDNKFDSHEALREVLFEDMSSSKKMGTLSDLQNNILIVFKKEIESLSGVITKQLSGRHALSEQEQKLVDVIIRYYHVSARVAISQAKISPFMDRGSMDPCVSSIQQDNATSEAKEVLTMYNLLMTLLKSMRWAKTASYIQAVGQLRDTIDELDGMLLNGSAESLRDVAVKFFKEMVLVLEQKQDGEGKKKK
eukprot:TRINITY_DN1574_c0_g1_i4.p1 TRINITY_DN1574_c0_g1~~TRINITY_DN1574_c0_g1_i4.p1  ORF type:complete len:246 (-),score=114.51 TRINITY_DN1574_c0_g1_i4:84-821(-)